MTAKIEHGFPRVNLLVVGALLMAVSLMGVWVNPKQLSFSLLTSAVFWFTIVMGGLFFTMLHHITSAKWSVVVRRISEGLMSSVPWLAIIMIPLFFFALQELYPWADHHVAEFDHLIHKKIAYLNPGFFFVRMVFFFLVWMILSKLLWKTSLKQDEGATVAIQARLKRLSAVGIIVFAITFTFAAFDWVMSLDPHWYSTIFGVYVFSGGLVGCMAILTLLTQFIQKRGLLVGIVTREHYHDLGKLLFAFTCFWAYMALSQYLLIWYANIPEETIWFKHRWVGSWKYVSVLIAGGHFVVPFLLMMSRVPKRHPRALTFFAVWMLIMHFVDVYWMVQPNLHHHGAHASWMDITTLAGVGCLVLGLTLGKLDRVNLFPKGDPDLEASKHFVNV